ncbi:enoyl-CoA hydratase/isomerase family protein [Chloroflexota bacterium]
MAYKDLIFTKENNVAWAKFNRPEVLNALTQELHVELQEAIREVRDDADVRIMVITGVGRGFAAGRDTRQQAMRIRGEPLPVIAKTRPSGSPWEIGMELWNLPKPVIAAVNGVAVGGGMSIVLESDIILASENARFGEFFVRKGSAGSGYCTFLLPRLIGPHKAKELLMTGELIDAKEAERLGLVNRVYPADGFEDTIKKYAERLAKNPIATLGQIKRLVNEGLSMSIESAGRAEIQSLALMNALHFDDRTEGTLAFAEKRAPKFKGASGPKSWSEAEYK